MYSRATKKKRKGAQEKEERVSITIYLHKKVWNDFEKFIASSGISVSRMMEAIMRVACNPEAAAIWERIYYAILKAMTEIQTKETKKSRKKIRQLEIGCVHPSQDRSVAEPQPRDKRGQILRQTGSNLYS